MRALDRPLGRAAAWGGGRVELWPRGARSAVAIALVERPGAVPLCASLRAWYHAARPRAKRARSGGVLTFGEVDRVAALSCRGSAIRLAIAPAPTLALALVRD